MSEIDDEKLDEIERCAEAATDGSWEKHTSACGYCILTGHKPLPERGPGWSTYDVEVCQVDTSAGQKSVEWDECERNADYIATADPPTVLALVEEVRRLREEKDRYREALKAVVERLDDLVVRIDDRVGMQAVREVIAGLAYSIECLLENADE